MKKGIWILGILVLILVIIVGALLFMLFTPSGFKQSLISTSTAPVADSYSVVTIKGDEASSTYSYEITSAYPQIIGLSNTDAQVKINTAINAVVKKEIDGFRADYAQNTEMGVFAENGTSTADITFQKEDSVPGVISLALNEYFYSAGAAHPGANVIALNYATSTGKAVTLSTLFTGNYLKLISQKSIELLTKQLGEAADKENIADGAGVKADNYQVYFPTPSGLKIIFTEYQVAGYAAGQQEVLIPYSDLKSVINPSGPLKSYLALN